MQCIIASQGLSGCSTWWKLCLCFKKHTSQEQRPTRGHSLPTYLFLQFYIGLVVGNVKPLEDRMSGTLYELESCRGGLMTNKVRNSICIVKIKCYLEGRLPNKSVILIISRPSNGWRWSRPQRQQSLHDEGLSWSKAEASILWPVIAVIVSKATTNAFSRENSSRHPVPHWAARYRSDVRRQSQSQRGIRGRDWTRRTGHLKCHPNIECTFPAFFQPCDREVTYSDDSYRAMCPGPTRWVIVFRLYIPRTDESPDMIWLVCPLSLLFSTRHIFWWQPSTHMTSCAHIQMLTRSVTVFCLHLGR